MKSKINLFNQDLQPPKSSTQEVLYHMIMNGSSSIISFRWLSGYRTRISNLRLIYELPITDKPEFGINKHGRKYRYVIHILENEHVELAKNIYRKMQKEETK